jgi:hypothetical protein
MEKRAMRLVIAMAAIAALSLPALAQQQQQQQQRQPGPPPSTRPATPAPAPQAQQPAAPPPGMFPCRSANEVCHVVAVGSGSQGTLLFSNAPAAEGKEGDAVTVQGVDLAQHAGRVVMLSGTFAGAAINGAQIIDVATPLVSFAIKLQLSSGGDDDQQSAPAPAQPQRAAPPPQAPRR